MRWKTARMVAVTCSISSALARLAAGGEPEADRARREVIVPRVQAGPVIDGTLFGELGDACWRRAATLRDFTQPKSKAKPAKTIEARLCFDDEALYIGFTCGEPTPEKIKAEATAEGMQVWRDDCVEVWIRTTDSSLEFDQFIANTLATRQSVRRRQSAATGGWEPSWRVAARVGREQWVAELAIPFSDLGIRPPRRGGMIQMKLGREERAGGGTRFATWPAGSSYAGLEDYAPVYFESSNLLVNPDMSEREGEKVKAWSFSEKGRDKALFRSASEGEKNVIRFDAPGRYCTSEQGLRLEPNALYRLEARVKGTAGVYLRARTVLKEDGKSVPHTATSRPSAEYVPVQVVFPSGPSGRALVILGNTDRLGRGRVTVADLRLVREVGYRDFGPAIPVAAGRVTRVEKLLVMDCRALKGFLGTPVDGSLASRDWAGNEYEYNRYGRASAGVGYAYKNNDGFHVTLADGKGFHAVLIRGGAKVKLYRDCDSHDEPGKGALLCEFPGRVENSRALFKKPVLTDRVSFFELTDGFLANVSFFRLSRGRGPLPKPMRYAVGGRAGEPDEPELSARFPTGGRDVYRLDPGAGRAGTVIEARADVAFHLMTEPLDEETPLAAVGLDLQVRDCAGPVPFTAAVQDPLNSRSELFGADFLLDGPGRLRLILDFPDQVLPKGSRIWTTLTFGASARLVGPDGKSPVVELYRVGRERALPEALAYRKFLMKTYFCSLSEARPWNGWYREKDIQKTLRSRYGPQIREFTATLDQCRALDAGDPMVKQFHEWIWRQNRPWREKHKRGLYLGASHARVEPVPGAPEWAVVARQAWLEAREVPRWWVENRMVATGEFGGEVGDDTDMYQNYADFPMFETGGVAAAVLDGADRLAELAERQNLEEGLNKSATDPLHAYEEGVNHIALLAWWHYGDPVYLERCIVNARSTEKLTVLTPKGHRHFKSQRLGAEDLRIDRKTDRDGHAHPLMWHPALEVAWYNRNPKAVKLLCEWADGWLEHQERGRYATSVRVATEEVTATDRRPFRGGYGAQGCSFRFLQRVTGEDKYVRPYQEYIAGGTISGLDRFLPDLARAGGLGPVHEKAAGLAAGRGAADFVLNGNKTPLIQALKVDIAEMQNYRIMYTTAEPFTDRVFLYAIRNAAIAYTGGHASRNKFDHSHAASWEGFGTDYAALVLTARRDAFKALVYNFSDRTRNGKFRLWTLEHGRYGLTFGPDADADDAVDEVRRQETVEVARARAVPLALPPKTVMVLELRQLERLDDIRLRADLAVSPRELKVEGGSLRGVVHNIGSRAARSFEVALVDANGTVRARRRLGRLEAPLDLVPRKIKFALEGVGADTLGWAVLVDPADEIPEIYEGNNRVVVGLE